MVYSLAEWFVAFARAHADWSEPAVFADDEIQKISRIVEAAGFEPSSVAVGPVMGQRYLNGEYTGMFKANPHSPFKVIGEEGKDHGVATRWLNCLWELVNPPLSRPTGDPPALVETVEKEIKRSVPLAPIPIGPDGEMLLEYPPASLGFFVDHANDEKKVCGCVGVHKYCGGWVDRKRASKKYDALVCRRCGLRVTFPHDVNTYGELRNAMTVLERRHWRWNC